MKLFPAKQKTEYAILLDIGSGSVSLTVIDLYDKNKKIVWGEREQLLLKSLEDVNRSAKQIMTATADLLMRFHSKGVKTLNSGEKKALFSIMQVSVAAPFAHTVSKKVFYQEKEPFTLNKDLLKNLFATALEKIVKNEEEITEELSLVAKSRTVIEEKANGYPISVPKQQKVKKLELALLTTFLNTYIDNELNELQEKLFPETKYFNYSFISMLYLVLKDINPKLQEYCLVNQTLEATELAVVRDGVLTYTTYDEYGIASLIREISETIGNPIEEVFASIKSDVFSAQYEKLSAKKRKKIDGILQNYEQRIVDLLEQTGDSFTIPKSIYLHTVSCTYDFFAERIEKGAEKTTGFGHIVHNLSADSLRMSDKKTIKEKSCIELVSQYFFHNCAESVRYKQI